MAVPVLRDLVETTLSLQQRLLRGTSRLMTRKREGLQGLARALPRADALFALPRQRFDAVAGRLRTSLFQNVQRHRAVYARVSALLRPRVVSGEIQLGRKHAGDLEARLARAYGNRLRRASAALEGHARVLESVSYRAVLARGFALVKGADGGFKRRAAAIKAGEALTLTFADGEAKAAALGKADGKPVRETAKKPGQGDLF